MTLRCATYARYSSDRQSPASIQDQIRKCKEYASKQGWQFLEDHVYADEALSGAGADRPEFARMLQAASQLPRPLDVLLLDDTSRLSRNQGETARIFERLNFLGVRIVAVSQGIDSQSEQADVLVTVHGLVDSLFIKELAKKTHRGLEGRALKGLCTGGRCYGYNNIREGDAVRQQINAAEAVIVRRIFELAANDFSLKTIAKTLNAKAFPPPDRVPAKSMRHGAPLQYAPCCGGNFTLGGSRGTVRVLSNSRVPTNACAGSAQRASGWLQNSRNFALSMRLFGNGFRHELRV